MASDYVPRRAGGNIDKARCRASVPDSTGWHFRQCSRKVEGDALYCRQHDPEHIAEQNRRRHQRYLERAEARKAIDLSRAKALLEAHGYTVTPTANARRVE